MTIEKPVIDIEKLKADRAAAEKVAPAPWSIGTSKSSYGTTTTRVFDASGNNVCDDEVHYPAEVDPLLQERIARLPDLEALVIEMAEFLPDVLKGAEDLAERYCDENGGTLEEEISEGSEVMQHIVKLRAFMGKLK